MDRLLHYISRKPWPLVWALGTVICFLALTQGFAPPTGLPGIIELQLAFSLQRFNDILQAWGPEITDTYRQTMWIDYIYAVMYGLTAASLIWLLGSKSGMKPQRVKLLACLPLIAAGFDWVENGLHLVILNSAPTAGLVWTASLAALVKWLLTAVFLVVICYLLAIRLVRLVR